MEEREPKQESQENTSQAPEQLTMEEKQDLSNLWETLGTGNPLDVNADTEAIRSQMWENTQQALLEKILPNLKGFERNQELEHAVRNAPEQSDERANAEFALIKNYMEQFATIPDSGYSTTPKLSEKYEYSLNCVMKSALATILFEKNGVASYAGKVAGHSIVISRDTLGNYIYADPNGIIGKLEQQPEMSGDTIQYVLSADEQDRIGTPFSLIGLYNPKIGFVSSMIGNLDKRVLKNQKVPLKALLPQNTKLLSKRSWGDMREKIFPEMLALDGEQWRNERIRVKTEDEYEERIKQNMKRAFFGKNKHNNEIYQAAMAETFEEIKQQDLVESVFQFLNSPQTHHAPDSLRADSQKILRGFSKELEKAKQVHPELRNRLIARFVKIMHQ